MFQHITDPNQLPNDEYLEKDTVLELHHRLIEQANEIVANSLKAMSELTENQEMDPDELDAAISSSNRDLTLRFADRERKMLKKIQKILTRIQKGVYGSCEECDDEIGSKRLLYRPVASLCIDCKTQEEQLENNSWSI